MKLDSGLLFWGHPVRTMRFYFKPAKTEATVLWSCH